MYPCAWFGRPAAEWVKEERVKGWRITSKALIGVTAIVGYQGSLVAPTPRVSARRSSKPVVMVLSKYTFIGEKRCM